VNAYLQESEENVERLFRLEEVYHLGKYGSYADPERMRQAERRLCGRLASEQARLGRRLRMRRWMSYAAIFVLVALLGGGSAYLLYGHASKGDLLTVTAYGQDVRQFILPDSTKVWLNGGASLTYPSSFGDGTRDVSLVGEAYFEVTKDASRPFVVKSDAMRVRVLGTKFNFATGTLSHVAGATLIEGEVEVSGNNDEGQIILTPGQRAELDKNSGRLTVKQVNARLDAVWHDDLIPFDRATIFTIARTLEQLYGIRIILSPDISNSKTYSGVLKRKDSVEGTLKLLQNVMPIGYKNIGDSIFLLPAAGR
jgi:ferric-dicitrate binding protein FerR (iron transport regulator)